MRNEVSAGVILFRTSHRREYLLSRLRLALDFPKGHIEVVKIRAHRAAIA